ncbi:MAG: PKD domain-containing protein, partial [Bacteroidota bacterium]
SDLSTLFWSTYLGGTGLDHCSGLRVDDANNVYVTGYAGSDDFPMVAGGVQENYPGGGESAYLVKLSANGSALLNGTFWGTASEDRSYFVDIDEDDQIHIYGLTKGSLPITPDTWFAEPGSNQFVAAFSNDLSSTVYSTVVGGPTQVPNGNNFVPVAFMVDKCNGIYLSGFNATDGLPLTTDAVFTRGNSFYLAVLEPNATDIIFGSYYGDANHVDGGTSRFDKGGVVYQGVCSCQNNNRVLNVTSNAWETFQDTECDVGVFKIDFDVDVVTAAGVASPSTSGCLPLTIDFAYTGRDAQTIRWDFGDNSTDAGRNVTHTFTEAGNYTVLQIAESTNACNLSDTFRLQVVVLDGNSTRTELSFCEGEEITFLDASVPGATYEWQDASTAATFQPEENGVYWVDITVDGCTRRDSFLLVPTSGLAVELGAPQLTVCDEPSFTLEAGRTSSHSKDSTG